MKPATHVIAIAATLGVALGCNSQQRIATVPDHPTPSAKSAPSRHGYVLANGVNYYYELHGRGAPLLLLHGGMGSTELFEPDIAALAKTHEVIAVDLHGHGRTALGDRPIRLTDMADDMATIIDKLGYRQVDAMGYSLGGGVAFRLAVQHPSVVRRLVLVSAGFATEGFYPEMLVAQAQVGPAVLEMMKQTPMYQSYVKLAPHPEEFPKLLDRMGELMRGRYDWRDDVAKVRAPTLLVFGDSDMFRLEHVVEFYKLLGGGQRDAGWQREHMAKNRLAILPDVTHYEMGASPKLVPTVLPFLDAAPTAGEHVTSAPR